LVLWKGLVKVLCVIRFVVVAAVALPCGKHLGCNYRLG
jgi:hypothetical protein